MENIFYQKLKNINRDIFNNSDYNVLSLEIDSLFIFIKENFSDFEYFKRLEDLINILTGESSLKNKDYTNGFVKKYLNIFFKEIKTDVYSSWGLLLNKIISRKTYLFYPLIYSAIFKVYFNYFDIEESMESLVFPIDDKTDLFEIIKNISDKSAKLIENSTSYDLLFYPVLRNKIILFLYDLYKNKNKLNVWFCISGIGIEPLLFSYILNLLYEAEKENEKMKGLKIYSSDAYVALLTSGVESSYLNDFILKTRKDFAEENFIKEKDIKTTIKDARKNLIIKENDFLQTGKVIEDSFDILIINSLKYSDFDIFGKKIEKRFKQLAGSGKETYVLIQVRSKKKIEFDDFIINEITPERAFEEIFIDNEVSDCFMDFLLYKIPANQATGDSSKDNLFDLNYFLSNHRTLDKKSLKNLIHKIDKKSIKTKKDNLAYSFILAEAELFNKSFDILKYNFSANYNYSYKILKTIISNCRNKKLAAKAENFIVDNQIKEQGFSQELFDALTDGINEFENENKKSKWL